MQTKQKRRKNQNRRLLMRNARTRRRADRKRNKAKNRPGEELTPKAANLCAQEQVIAERSSAVIVCVTRRTRRLISFSLQRYALKKVKRRARTYSVCYDLIIVQYPRVTCTAHREKVFANRSFRIQKCGISNRTERFSCPR